MCAGITAGEVEDTEEVGWYAGEIGCDDVEVGEVGCGAREVQAAIDGLPTTADGLPSTVDGLPSSADGLSSSADGLPSSPRFGGGEHGGADEVVNAGDDDLDIDEDAPCAPPTPATHAYSTVKSWCAAADPSSTSLSHAQPDLHRI